MPCGPVNGECFSLSTRLPSRVNLVIGKHILLCILIRLGVFDRTAGTVGTNWVPQAMLLFMWLLLCAVSAANWLRWHIRLMVSLLTPNLYITGGMRLRLPLIWAD